MKNNLIHKIFPYRDFLYLFQLEEYYLKPYFKTFSKRFFRRHFEKHGSLKLTFKIKVLFILSVLLTFLPSILSFVLTPNYLISTILAIISIFLIPFWIYLSALITFPLDFILKAKIYQKAHQKIKENPNLQIICIVGSHGKTTTKNFISQFLETKYHLQTVPGNINTPIGISNWLVSNLKNSTQILILEADTYQKGELKQTFKIINPHFVILTNIGDQHLSRFGNRQNLAAALFEAFQFSHEKATLITLELTWQELQKFHLNLDLLRNKDCVSLSQKTFPDSHLGKSQQKDLLLSLKIAEIFQIDSDIIREVTKKLEIPDRRNKLIQVYGFETLDDSYNISFSTAQEGLEKAQKLAQEKHKKLLVITAGIPELSSENQENNLKYAEKLNQQADFIVLLKSVFYFKMKEKIDPRKLLESDSRNNAWKVIQSKFKQNDILVLMQPGLTDLYY